ncbi:GNAT family N-acetyltransferase [Lentzea albidocapillata]|uniref:Acetyltransferase (GNAT) domain-containing protein n=1 Tax=Lentzea albidocapillata TaxID=40571 RepID=A0A1W2FRD7_9PSEU|nr:GNAT family N-acetyltransferase [Lentzea albidocapillata]SMD24480.1 Acetyltransferase (GNAT) domain-containing protein [Lentzea albidocapillata]
MSADQQEPALTWVTPSHHAFVEQAIALGDTHRQTLGMLPHEVYHEAARKRCLLVALQGRTVAAYALIRLPRREVSLTHLCVSRAARGRGLAQMLLGEVSETYSDRLGIRAKCRDDYGLDPTWRRLGFTARAKTSGRGLDQAPMTVWWRDHGHPDLFTAHEQPTAVLAAPDVEILLDLHRRRDEKTAERSLVLEAQHLTGILELVVTSAISRCQDNHGGSQSLSTIASTRKQRRGHPDEAQRWHDIIDAELNKSRSLVEDIDVWQVAEAVAASLPIYLTWKEEVIEQVGPVVRELTGLRIFAPSYVITHLQAIADTVAYQPQAWHGSSCTSVRAGDDVEDHVHAFTNNADTDGSRLREQLRQLASASTPCWLIRSEQGQPLALYATEVDASRLFVPLLRLNESNLLAATVAQQLLWTLRLQAREAGASFLSIEDSSLPDIMEEACDFQGLLRNGAKRVGVVVDHAGSAAAVSARANSALLNAGLPEFGRLPGNLAAEVAAQYERLWWPAKLTDSQLPCFVVPIQPTWSSELLGEPAPMTPRPIQLALGREQVYYRRPGNNRLTVPGRIVWYQSQHPRLGPARFIGVSSIDSIHLDTPEALHEAFGHFGVFSLDDITTIAERTGKAQAVQVSNTELFTSPISRRTYDKLAIEHGGPKSFQSPVPISSALFTEIYQAGMPSSTMIFD